MRYDTKIRVIDEKNVTIDELYGNVSSVGTEKQNQLFGNLKEDRLVVRIRHFKPYRSGYLMIAGKKYRIIKKVQSSKNTAFYVGEYR